MNSLTFAAMQGRKRNPNRNFWSGCLRWGGGLPRQGVGAKKFGMSFETQGNRTFWRDIPKFAGIFRGCQKKLWRKSLCSILVPWRCFKFNRPQCRTSRFAMIIAEWLWCSCPTCWKVKSGSLETPNPFLCVLILILLVPLLSKAKVPCTGLDYLIWAINSD